MKLLPKKMFAGICDGQIYAEESRGDPYTPIRIALFRTRAEAAKYFESVVEVNAASMLAVGDSKGRSDRGAHR